MDYGFEHDGQVFTPNRTSVRVETNIDRNKEIETSELARWKNCPETFVAYYALPADAREYFGRKTPVSYRGTLSTWLGTKIGTITQATVYQHNFGGRFVSIRAIGSNGAEYYGRASYDGGDVIQLRRVK